MNTNDRIYHAYRRSGLSAEDFAEKIGISWFSIYNYTRDPSASAFRIAPEPTARLAEILYPPTQDNLGE
mgnify:CR=1 FL=1